MKVERVVQWSYDEDEFRDCICPTCRTKARKRLFGEFTDDEIEEETGLHVHGIMRMSNAPDLFFTGLNCGYGNHDSWQWLTLLEVLSDESEMLYFGECLSCGRKLDIDDIHKQLIQDKNEGGFKIVSW